MVWRGPVLQMASTALRPTSNFTFTLRALVVIAYFALTILFYIRAPSAATPGLFPSHSNPAHLKSASRYRTVGVFGDAMVAMLGSTEEPFTVFVPSHAAFLNASALFRQLDGRREGLEELGDANSAAYAIMSNLLSFCAVPKPVLSKQVPFGTEVVLEAISGFLLSVTRVRGKGMLVNNITCAETDLRRGRVVIHVVNGVVMDSEFEQSMGQATVLTEEVDAKPDWEDEDPAAEEENESRAA